MGYLLLLFIVVPAVELALLIELGRHVGTVATLGVIAATGLLGAWLARVQGMGALARVRRELDAGSVPAGPIVDGVLILIAGAVLMTPGLLTDAFGFALLVPKTRSLIRGALRRRFEAAQRAGEVHVERVGGFKSEPRDVNPRPPES